MKTIETKVYTFDELSGKAQGKARDWYRSASAYDDGARIFEDVKEDTLNIGLRIVSLDQHKANQGDFDDSAENVAAKILKEHGDQCETYKTAAAFLAEVKALEDAHPANAEYSVRDAEGFDALEGEFMQSLLEDYRIMYEKDVDYQNSDEVVDESILANEYTFTEDGKRFG